MPTVRLQRRNLLTHIQADINIVAAGLLYDMAALQSSQRSAFGYKRAGKVIATAVDVSLRDLVASGTVRDVPYVGRASERIIADAVASGDSGIVAAAIAASSSSKRSDLEKRRRFRRAYLSRHAMLTALEAPLGAAIVGPASFRGDLQMHSTWSDGVETIASLAEGAEALGWSRIGVTDHSYGLPIARGMSMDAARQQHREIDALNERLAGRVRVYKGIEANILADGSLDLSTEERAVFEYVLASPHSALRREHDQTARMLAAVRGPGVAILGHPQGRVYNSRPGVTADWARVFAEAAQLGVAIEIDGNWHRQDVDYELAALALDAGCFFALDSDAHSIAEFPFTDYSIAHARIAGVPADRVVNCWPERKFDAWLNDRRA
ncbi:MAG TPA: PHP domain-containing protein [Vicinamibacterales bacterium]|nr:PHP domain-containing protein [Vicinamibacterales bacterium]